MSEVHGYFVDQARAAFVRAQGDPDKSHALAVWAEHARTSGGDPRSGVLVSEDGEILAETLYTPSTPSTPGAAYVVSGPPEVNGLLVGLAEGTLRRSTGRGVIHVKYSEVCVGAGRFV